jgi:hypothetical protein
MTVEMTAPPASRFNYRATEYLGQRVFKDGWVSGTLREGRFPSLYEPP